MKKVKKYKKLIVPSFPSVSTFVTGDSGKNGVGTSDAVTDNSSIGRSPIK